jgi:hypothetical protein
MNLRLTRALLALALITGATGGALAGESNFWPFWVGQTDAAGKVQEWQAVGPLVFKKYGPETVESGGVRPLYLWKRTPAEALQESTVLYPIFSQRASTGNRSWTVFNLINRSRPPGLGVTDRDPSTFDVWPVYFSRETGSSETSYKAVFPIHGTIKRRLGYDRLDWTLFPLYARSEKGGVISTSTPWPFLKHSEGNGHHGRAFWPLYGQAEKPGDYRKRYILWPLMYRNETHLADPVPTVKEGFLPFYTREKSAEAVSESYLWPFFGYTDRQAPKRYHEVRYLWPLLVQGRGEERHVNRWGPFYTHSVVKGVDKTWVGWPLIRQQQWRDGDLDRTRNQLLFFVFWSEHQRSVARPDLPAASRTHFWPLLTVWDNGAGRLQVQFPSPLDVFFPENDRIRQLYGPLFAIYRLDQRAPGEVRRSVLWNAITWYRSPQRSEFHFGPLFSAETGPSGRRLAIGNGLIGLRRSPTRGWRFFLFDFSRSKEQPAPSTTP